MAREQDVAERLAADRPFRGRLDPASVERLPGWKGGRASALFVAGTDGRPFKLRVCASAARARRLAALLRRVPGVFPRLEGRDGRYLLLERLVAHRRLDEASLPAHARGLGRRYAELHRGGRRLRPSDRVAGLAASRRARRKFEWELASLRQARVIDADETGAIAARFREGLRRHGLAAGLELRDLHAGNVMADAGGDLRFVDEESLGFAVRGLGYAKLLAPVDDPRCHDEFRAGYAELGDPGFLAPDAARFLRLVDAVHSLDSKVRRGAEPAKVARTLALLRRAVEA